MPRSPWLGVFAGAAVLALIIVWASWGSGDGRRAATAIMQAQRDINAVHEMHEIRHAEIDQDALRAAEADLLSAQTAYNQSQFTVAITAAERASQTAQGLLTNQRVEPQPESSK